MSQKQGSSKKPRTGVKSRGRGYTKTTGKSGGRRNKQTSLALVLMGKGLAQSSPGFKG